MTEWFEWINDVGSFPLSQLSRNRRTKYWSWFWACLICKILIDILQKKPKCYGEVGEIYVCVYAYLCVRMCVCASNMNRTLCSPLPTERYGMFYAAPISDKTYLPTILCMPTYTVDNRQTGKQQVKFFRNFCWLHHNSGSILFTMYLNNALYK